MALSIVNNVASVTAQNNLTRTSSMLNKSLERLSSGLKINRGADGPAGLVISEQQRAQIAGLKAAIDNTTKAASLVQTSEGALNEINGLLVKIRSLAVDSANVGYNDNGALAANQSEIANALDTITSIANNTQFGSKKLLDGSRALSVTSGSPTVASATASGSLASGAIAVTVGATTASRANVAGANVTAVTFTGGTQETLTVNGVNINFVHTGTANGTVTAAANAINNASAQTGVRGIVDTSGGGQTLRLYSTAWGSDHQISVSSSLAPASSVLGTVASNVDGTDMTATVGGVSVTGVGNVLTVNSGAGSGLKVTFAATAAGDAFTSAAVNSFTAAATATNVTFTVDDSNSLQFQIGANAGQNVQVAMESMKATDLGQGTSASVASLAQVDVTQLATNRNLSSDILNVIDNAIGQVTQLRGTLGAFQSNSLESSANNLRTTLENTVAAESVVRDTDFAEEMAAFTKNQVMMQAGQTVLSNANQIPQMIAALLRG